MYGGIIAARRHAQTVEDIETCAPPVCAPYLQAAYERMKSGATVWYLPGIRKPSGEIIAQEPWVMFDNDGALRAWGYTPAEATRAYFNLTEPATAIPPVAATAGEQSSALSSHTADSSPGSAVTVGSVSTPENADRSFPVSAA